jgi:hypothetical protein
MNFRLTFIVVLLFCAPLVFTKTIYADAVTTSYTETGLNNREILRWDFHCDQLIGCNGFPAGQKAWNSAVTSDFIRDTLTFASRHLVGPHPVIDVDPGALFQFTVPFATINALPVNPVFSVLVVRTVVHPAFPAQHADIYTVFARRSLNGVGFDFAITAAHVPEPTSLLLLGTALAGFAIKTRKRFKSRRSAEGAG